MSDRLNQSRSTSQINKIKSSVKPETGIVVDVVLDENHPRLSVVSGDNSVFDKKETSMIPAAIIRPLHDNVSSDANLFLYKAYDVSDVDIPIIGETVHLIKIGNTRYYKRINSNFLNKGNAVINRNKNTYEVSNSTQNKSSKYNSTSQTGISDSTIKDNDSTFGTYFQSTQTNKLKAYEGDKLVQSRFGQSIRFSGYNNDKKSFSPTIIIRNRQNDESLGNLKEGQLIEEDVNKDGSIVAITSGDYKLPFQPGIVDSGGSTNFQTSPVKFPLPSEWTGVDQILINSGRIIISSKSAEMVFFSKGNYGFISDGKFIIDNGQDGADLDFNGNVDISTNNNDFKISTGNGNILLNTTSKEQPIARAQAVVDIISELIDLIGKQVFATPSGPSGAGPTNKAEFEALKQKLENIKSTLNFTE